jgi:hypothetical protein
LPIFIQISCKFDLASEFICGARQQGHGAENILSKHKIFIQTIISESYSRRERENSFFPIERGPTAIMRLALRWLARDVHLKRILRAHKAIEKHTRRKIGS